jgi:hypothetical protein
VYIVFTPYSHSYTLSPTPHPSHCNHCTHR